MNVLSLFDGMSCGQIALNKVGIKYDKYFASEIDKYPIQVTQSNYPDTIQLGDVKNIKGVDLPKIDLMFGGSPCQGFSKEGKQLNFEDPRSKLFFEFVRILKEVKPKYFLLENVKMNKESQNIISKYLGVEPVLINSNILSAQNRPRLYWTNIPFELNTEKKDSFKFRNIVQKDVDEKYNLDLNKLTEKFIKDNTGLRNTTFTEKRTEEAKRLRKEHFLKYGKDYTPRRAKELFPRTDDKSNCLTATFSNKEHLVIDSNGTFRKLTPIEFERLQTIPDNYTNFVSDNQRYRMIGNGWTVDVIAHIFKNIK